MNKKLLYTRDYYTLKRIYNEEEFIELLNEKTLIDLVLPPLRGLIEKLYLKITTDEQFTDFNSVVDASAEDRIDKLLAEKLIVSKSVINNNGVPANLFANIFLKLCRRIFLKDGHNDEKYLFQSYIHFWLEFHLAMLLSKDDRFMPYELVRKLMNQTEMLHHFFDSFKRAIPVSWINSQEDLWIKVPADFKKTLDSIRNYRGSFDEYERQLDSYSGFSPWKYVDESTHSSDYVMLNEEYSFKSIILLEKNISLWLKFWDNLKWPILQDTAFHYVNLDEDILKITRELVDQKSSMKSPPKHLACILLKNLFDSSVRTKQNLSFYNNDVNLKSLSEFERNEKLLAEGKEASVFFDKEEKEIYTETVDALLNVLSVDEMSEWVFSYKPRTPGREKHNDLYNEEIHILLDAFRPYISSQPFINQIEEIAKDFNFQKFNYLISQISSDSTNKENAKKLLDIFSEFILSNKFFWDGTFSEIYWPSLKGIGLLLSLLENPIAQATTLIDDFKTQHEGWNISPQEYNITQREAFVSCGAILLMEHQEVFKKPKEKETYFKYILYRIVSQTRFSVFNRNNDYKLPLYLFYLVANQIYIDLKELYETEIIKQIDNLDTVIEILTSDSYELSKESKHLMKKRIESEFDFKKRKLLQRGDSQKVEDMEKAINKLALV